MKPALLLSLSLLLSSSLYLQVGDTLKYLRIKYTKFTNSLQMPTNDDHDDYDDHDHDHHHHG